MTVKKARQYLFSILLITVGTVGMYDPPIDPDFGWHFKYGEYFAKNHNLLRTNEFSYTLPEYNWINSYWFFEIVLYLLHINLGSIAATLAVGTILSIALFVFLNNYTKDMVTISVVFLLGIFLFKQLHIAIRPHLYSTLFFLFLMVSLEKKKYLSLLPVVFAFWANIHAEFVIGLFVFGVYCLATFIQNFKTEKFGGLLSKLNIIFVLSLLTTFINPYGINLWVTMFKEMVQPVNGLVGEWQSPIKHAFNGYIEYLFYIPLILFILLQKKVQSQPAATQDWYKIVQSILLLFAINSTYMLRPAFIVALPGFTTFLDSKKLNTAYQITVAILGAALLVIGIRALSISNIWEQAYGMPYKEVAYIKTLDNLNKSNVFNYYGWGGYLIWQLPEQRIFIDGRMTGWLDGNEYFTKNYRKIRETPEANKELLSKTFEKYNIKYVMDKRNSPLVTYLQTQGWQTLVKTDHTILISH